MPLNREQWRELLERLSIPDDEDTFAQLEDHYLQTIRKYHNDQHIKVCLEQFGRTRRFAEHPDEVEVAIWFHDAIYNPKRSDNESKSAAWAASFLRKHQIDDTITERVKSNILATQHNQVPERLDERLVVDVDLSILGQPPDSYEQFESAIRQEYKWVPSMIFRRKRRAILQSFLDRPSIYSTDWFIAQYEDQARQNLKRAIRKLKET